MKDLETAKAEMAKLEAEIAEEIRTVGASGLTNEQRTEMIQRHVKDRIEKQEAVDAAQEKVDAAKQNAKKTRG